MPRKARLSIPGAVTHLMARCLDGLELFPTDSDKTFFLQLLSRYITETGCKCYAWALMENHYHIVVRLGDSDLWRTMKPLNMRYAQFYNSKYNRRGPLFMDRFKSIVTQDQNYIQELVRYVHLNPIRSGICKDVAKLDRYPWTGHQAIIGKRILQFQNTRDVLACFSDNTLEARERYKEFLSRGLETVSDDEVVELVRSSNRNIEKGRSAFRWVIGDHDFVKKAVKEAEMKRIRLSDFRKNNGDLSSLASKVCTHFKIDIDSLAHRSRGGAVSYARKAFCYAAIRIIGAPTKQAAEFLHMSAGAASNLIQAGKRILETEKISI